MKKTTLISFAFLMLIDAGVLTAQTKSSFCQELSWAPDGSRIAFSARTEKEPYEIYLVNADG